MLTVHNASNNRPSYDNRDYTVGWICALSIEQAAAQSMLDDVHDPPPQDQHDTNAYEFGSIYQHKTVIASLGLELHGTNNAATVATHMHRSFPNLQVRLMVGIGGAGGVPAQLDVRLGDVVVGTEVVQHDLGKSMPEGRFARQQRSLRPPQILSTALTKLRGQHDLRPTQIPNILASLKSTDASKHCKYPGADKDLLFDGYYNHKAGEVTCKHCDRSRLVPRSNRDSHEPKVHYGLIGSGNQLQKAEGRRRDALAKELGGAICFEMEAAGLFDNFTCLSIRGISDYSDTHKNNQWKSYASMTAAAYAKELLSVIAPRQKRPPALVSLAEDHRRSVLNSLKYHGIDSRKSNIKRPHKATCEWLAKLPQFVEWHDWAKSEEHHGFLWIQGKPGAGKSTMLKFLFQRAQSAAEQQEETTAVSFFFHAQGLEIERSALGMYRSLLLQIFSAIPSLQELLDKVHPQTEWNMEELYEILYKAIKDIGAHRLFIFIDALDECKEDEVKLMIHQFEELWEGALGSETKLFICFSSRHYPVIDISRGIRVTMEHQTGHKEDMESYVNSNLLINSASTKAEVTAEIMRKASGIFLWVVLVVNVLAEELRRGNIHSLRERLKQTPPGLNDLFRDLLFRDSEGNPQNTNHFQLCIQLILHTWRPLTISEFYSAMVFSQDKAIVVTREMGSSDNMSRYLLNVSKGLAQVSRSRVEFIHESVRELFLQENELWSDFAQLDPRRTASSHDLIKGLCHGYETAFLDRKLNKIREQGVPWSEDDPIIEEDIAQNQREFPFLEYAGFFQFFHAEKAAATIRQVTFLEDFVRRPSHWRQLHQFVTCKFFPPTEEPPWYSLTWGRLVRPGHRRHWHRHVTRGSDMSTEESLWYYLARTNRRHLTLQALELVSQPGYRTRYGISPLIGAINGKHDELAMELVEKGVDLNETTPKGQTPIHAAIENDRESLARYLIEQGAKIHAEYPVGFSVLRRAVKSGSSAEFVSFLIRSGANVNDHQVAGESLLRDPIENKNDDVVAVLLSGGIRINKTCLLLAINTGCLRSLELQLDYITSIDDHTELLGLALDYAMSRGYWECVEVLVQRGADPSALSRDLGKDLFRAWKDRCENIVSLLLSQRMNVNGRGVLHGNGLQKTIRMGYQDLVKLYISHGADINKIDSYYGTALQTAAFHRQHGIAALLLSHGASMDVHGGAHGHALEVAATRGYLNIVELLISQGADINKVGTYHGSAIHAAAFEGHREVFSFLLDNGANVKGSVGNHGDVLEGALARHERGDDRYWMISALIYGGADLRVPDRYETVLRMALELGDNDLASYIARKWRAYGQEERRNIEQLDMGEMTVEQPDAEQPVDTTRAPDDERAVDAEPSHETPSEGGERNQDQGSMCDTPEVENPLHPTPEAESSSTSPKPWWRRSKRWWSLLISKREEPSRPDSRLYMRIIPEEDETPAQPHPTATEETGSSSSSRPKRWWNLFNSRREEGGEGAPKPASRLLRGIKSLFRKRRRRSRAP